jgi:hypothetical protein
MYTTAKQQTVDIRSLTAAELSNAYDQTTIRALAEAELSAVSGGGTLNDAIRNDLDSVDQHKAVYLLYRPGTTV